ncbi:hypothetical protein FKM82_017092 [Ascaphus truei]
MDCVFMLDSGRGSSLLDRAIADRRQLNTITLPDFSDPETGSIHATSIAASRVEQALSEVASSLHSSAPKQGPLHPWMTLAQIWLHAAEVYIGIGKPAEATACSQEAANLFPMSHNVLYMRGQVSELRGNIDEAKRWYEEALSISPTHVKSMQRLVSHREGRALMQGLTGQYYKVAGLITLIKCANKVIQERGGIS